MGSLLIAEPTLSDTGTVTLTTPSTDAPATNLQTTQPKEVAETTDVTGNKDAIYDLGTSASYDFFALMFTNLTASATWSIATDDNAGFSSPTTILASTGFRAPGQTGLSRVHGYYKHASTLTERYVRLRLADATNPAALLRLGRAYIAKAWRVDADYGLLPSFDEAPAVDETWAGEEIAQRREPRPSVALSLMLDGPTAWATLQDNLHELFRKRGNSRDVVVILDPEDASYGGRLLYYGRLQEQLAYSFDAYQLYRTQLRVRGMV